MRKALAIELLEGRRLLTTQDRPAWLVSPYGASNFRKVDEIEVSEWHHRLSFRLLFERDGTRKYVDYSYVGNYAILWDEPEEGSDVVDPTLVELEEIVRRRRAEFEETEDG